MLLPEKGETMNMFSVEGFPCMGMRRLYAVSLSSAEARARGSRQKLAPVASALYSRVRDMAI